MIDRQLAVLTLDRRRSVASRLHLQLLDIATGAVVDTHPLLRLREDWWQRLSCQVLVADRRLFAVLGGVAFSTDAAGRVQWIRSSPSIPPVADHDWMAQKHQPPLLRDRYLILTQVGVPTVEAVEPVTGIRRWQRVMPSLQEVLGFVEDLVIVKSNNGISALEIASGRIKWQHADTHLLLAASCDAQEGIVYTRAERKRNGDEVGHVELICLDADTGQLIKSVAIDQLTGDEPNLGPVIAGPDRTWMFFGDGPSNGQRELVQCRAGSAEGEVR